jgi:signal transduction histidine kinase
MEGFLFNEGYNLTFATSGFETLNYLEKEMPDVILLDVLMPEMDGLEVCTRIRANKRWRHIPIILVTVLDDQEDLVRGLEAGADDFLHKPVNEPELRARVRSMLRIKKQYDELQAALRLREDLAYMIVHDMRSPLTTIQGFSELLLLKNVVPREHRDDIQQVHVQARRLNSFLNDMLIVAKTESGELILKRSSVDPCQLLVGMKENHEVIAQSKGIQILLDLPSESRPVLLDENLFQRVLDNLISNALKFSPAESKITLKLEYPPSNSKFQIRLQVIDEGPGIPEEHQARIFDKFEIVALKQRGITQVGLGLTFCKMVIDAHAGKICVESNSPTGSIFTIEV